MKWSDTENLCQAIKRLVKSRTEAVYSDGSGLLKSFIDIIKVQCSQMIDKKFAMRSTSSASLHQNSADVFFLEMIISDQSTRKSASPMYPGLVALSTKMCPGLPALGPF